MNTTDGMDKTDLEALDDVAVVPQSLADLMRRHVVVMDVLEAARALVAGGTLGDLKTSAWALERHLERLDRVGGPVVPSVPGAAGWVMDRLPEVGLAVWCNGVAQYESRVWLAQWTGEQWVTCEDGMPVVPLAEVLGWRELPPEPVVIETQQYVMEWMADVPVHGVQMRLRGGLTVYQGETRGEALEKLLDDSGLGAGVSIEWTVWDAAALRGRRAA